jgi:protein-disulfide isomerase
LLVMAACSPACTPPDAKSPEGDAAGDGGAPSRPLAADADSERDQKRAELAAPEASGDMIMEAKGVDTSQLTETQRTTFFQIINREPSACDQPHSIATSLRDDGKCRDSLIVAQFIADALASGAPSSAVRAEIDGIVDSLQPKEINIEGRAIYGAERAPVTIVMFADFECPHCRAEAPVLRKLVDQFRGRARLVFKHFPLGGHERSKPAAIAVEAAHEQGKFWEMHDLVFANQTKLSDADLLAYAKEAGLDVAKFKADLAGKKARATVDADRAEGETLDIQGTPAVFVNGRYVTDRLFGGTVAGWVDDALKR